MKTWYPPRPPSGASKTFLNLPCAGGGYNLRTPRAGHPSPPGQQLKQQAVLNARQHPQGCRGQLSDARGPMGQRRRAVLRVWARGVQEQGTVLVGIGAVLGELGHEDGETLKSGPKESHRGSPGRPGDRCPSTWLTSGGRPGHLRDNVGEFVPSRSRKRGGSVPRGAVLSRQRREGPSLLRDVWASAGGLMTGGPESTRVASWFLPRRLCVRTVWWLVSPE